jgi:ATP-dependent DNA ligase
MKPLLSMLATPAAPFDAAAYLFEVKWDGVRALAASTAGRWRLWGRTGTDYTAESACAVARQWYDHKSHIS